MKKGKILICYDAEKLNAIENYAAKKGVNLLAEIDETIGRKLRILLGVNGNEALETGA